MTQSTIKTKIIKLLRVMEKNITDIMIKCDCYILKGKKVV